MITRCLYIPTAPLSTPLMSLPKRFYLTAPAEAERTVCLEDTAKDPAWIQDLHFMLEKSDSANSSTESFLPGIYHQAYCTVWNFLEGRHSIGWEAKTLWPWTSYPFQPAHDPTGTPLLYPSVSTQCSAEPHRQPSPLNSNSRPHSETWALQRKRVKNNGEQVVKSQRSSAIGTAFPLLAARAELREGPGSRYGDLLYGGPQNIPSYQNDLNLGAWEGKQGPSIILKINFPLYSSPESINNVTRGKNLQWDLYWYCDFYSLAYNRGIPEKEM